MTSPDIRKKAVVIVDGFTALGRLLASRFLGQGTDCIEVLSHATFPKKFLKRAGAEDYLQDSLYSRKIVFDGRYDAAIRALQEYDVIGVLPGSETGIPLADALSERMGLHSNGTRHSMARRNKFLMQHTLIDAGVPTKQFICTADETDFIAWYRSGRFGDVVIKPAGSTASDGVTVCTSEEGALSAFHSLLGTKNLLGDVNRGVLIEERVTGREFVVTTVSREGRHRVAEIWEYRETKGGGVPTGTAVHDRSDEKFLPLIRYTFSVLDALGIRYGAATTEVMMTENGPLLIETGARVMGGTIPSGFVLCCAAACQVDLVVEAYCSPGEFLSRIPPPVEPSALCKKNASLRTA